VADVGEEKAFGDGDVGGILVVGGVARAFVGVPFPTNMGIAALLEREMCPWAISKCFGDLVSNTSA
jgi:hypothetical protein